MSRGELSYSKVRALTRVATPATEDTLLMIALHGTAYHVETMVHGERMDFSFGVAPLCNQELKARHHNDEPVLDQSGDVSAETSTDGADDGPSA